MAAKEDPRKILSDLRSQLVSLRSKKRDLDSEFRDLRTVLKAVHSSRIRKKEEVSRLAAKEADLNAKKMRAEEQIIALKDKITKMQKVGAVLEDVWE